MTYTWSVGSWVGSVSFVVCDYCGSLVKELMWGDHVHWHETIDLQATAVMRRSLETMEHSIIEDLG